MLLPLLMLQCRSDHGVSSDHINTLESLLRSDSEMDTAIANDLLDAYQSYIMSNPEDSLTPYLLLKEADLLQGALAKNTQALVLYQQMIEQYPDHPMVPRAIFMKGYVYDENLKNQERAIASYQALISQYPDHPLAGDARNLLNLLSDTLTTEEQVAKWLYQAQKDTNNI